MSQLLVRTFIAIELDQNLPKILKGIQDDLRQAGADVKWVEPHNIHLTLKFLGDVESEKMGNLINAVETGLSRYPAFSFDLTHLGAFPKSDHPKVLWVGVNSGKREIGKLVSILEDDLEILGFEKGKNRFAPHITIGRVRSSLNKFALSKILKSYSLPQPMIQKVRDVIVFKSLLTSAGPIYEALRKIPLI